MTTGHHTFPSSAVLTTAIALAAIACGPTQEVPEPSAMATRVAGLGSDSWQGGDKVIKLSAGVSHTCALFDQGGVRCWGDSGRGQLGASPSEDQPVVSVPTLGAGVVDIATGEEHSCALFQEGWVKCWGTNLNNELGRGPGIDSTAEQPISDAVVELLGAGVVDIEAGSSSTCARFEGGAIRCWGKDKHTDHEDYAYDVIDGMRDNRPTNLLGLQARPVGMVMRSGAACAWPEQGRAQCWGTGSLFDGPIQHIAPWLDKVSQIAIGHANIIGNHACAIVDGEAWCMGVNEFGEIGDGTSQERRPAPVRVIELRGTVVHIAAGFKFGCAVVDSGDIYCWGRNEAGRIGDGSMDSAPFPVQVVGLMGPADQVVAGAGHACALLRDGMVQCWGDNTSGQLGIAGDPILGQPPVPNGLF